MSPSTLFWIDVLSHLATAVVSAALLLLLIGIGARRRVNRRLALFMLTILAWVASSLTLRAALWFETGTPLTWMEMTTGSFGFFGPTLFLFAITYTESDRRWHRLLAWIGPLAILILLIPLFSHQVVSDVYLGERDLVHWQLTGFGYLAASITFIFQALALLAFWQDRKKINEPAMIISVAILLLGGVVGVIERLPIPTITLATVFSVLTIGYTVMKRQLFNPLQTLTQQLETQVAERTRELQQTRSKLQRLIEQQQTAAEISREVSQAATPAKMLDILVDQIHNRLGYHHVYVYQPDATGSYLVLKSAAGTTSRTLLEKNHRIPQSENYLPSQAAVKKQPRLAEAKDDDAIYFGDTALPGARAEIALPLLAGNRLLGVLDLQSIHFEAFSDTDLTILAPLADQVAITLDNARLLQGAEEALNEAQRIQSQYVQQAWQTALGPQASESTGSRAFTFTPEGQVKAVELKKAWSPEIAQAATTGQIQFPSSDQAADETDRSTVAVPVILRGQVIGAMQLRHQAGRAWQPDELEALRDIAERLALSLENARLFQETRVRAGREQLARKITDKMRRATDMDELMQITIQEMANALGTPNTFIQLSTLKTAERRGAKEVRQT